jgi:electron transfer flavoprotein beta subunit
MEKDTNTPRLPSYLRRKAVNPEQIKVYSLKDFPNADVSMLGINGSPTRVERIFSPEVRKGQPLLEGDADNLSQELYNILCNEKFV